MGAATHLGIRLREYDARIRTFIPHYEEMLDAAAAALRALDRRAPVVLDLGIGSGALAVRCVAAAAGARIIGVDNDGGMLALAQKRLGGRLTSLPGDFCKFSVSSRHLFSLKMRHVLGHTLPTVRLDRGRK
ncbi:MAG: class I SAM-dependent methyltransferase, partial [candidate division NC10 bacterium]|nr:class I SAM-dependent methyltransferase [candidate division NC10 bacterium]